MKARAPGPTSRAPEVSGKLKAPRADRERRTALRATVGDSRGTVGERELQAMCLPLLLPLVLDCAAAAMLTSRTAALGTWLAASAPLLAAPSPDSWPLRLPLLVNWAGNASGARAPQVRLFLRMSGADVLPTSRRPSNPWFRGKSSKTMTPSRLPLFGKLAPSAAEAFTASASNALLMLNGCTSPDGAGRSWVR